MRRESSQERKPAREEAASQKGKVEVEVEVEVVKQEAQ